MRNTLTDKQEKFSQAIANGEFDYAWQAYKAYYDVTGNSIDTVYVATCKLMQTPPIIKRIAELRERIKKRNEATFDEVLLEMSAWLRFDPLEAMDEWNAVKDLEEMSLEARKCVAEIRVQELYETVDKVKFKIGEIKTVKFIDKRATADMFMKKFGAYITTVKVDTEDLSHLKEVIKGIKE